MDLSLSLLLIRFTAGLLLMGPGDSKDGPRTSATWGFRPASLSISALVVGQLFVAIAKAHWAKGLWIQAGGYEYPLLLMVIAVAVGGPGRYSADAALGWDR